MKERVKGALYGWIDEKSLEKLVLQKHLLLEVCQMEILNSIKGNLNLFAFDKKAHNFQLHKEWDQKELTHPNEKAAPSAAPWLLQNCKH